jgi:cytochrome c-type biogenesis protein
LVEASILVSALAGAGSFFSPCILPIIPAFVSYLSGTTLSEIQGASAGSSTSVTVKKSVRLNIFLNTVYFVLGFSLIFAVLGVILNSFLANIGTGFQSTFQTIGGAVIITFGAYLILSAKLRLLNFERRINNLPRFKTTYLTSFVFGAAFASGWTPCVGPILGTTLTLAATSPGAAYNSLLAYSLGLGVPFLITGAFFSRSTKIIKKMVKHLKYFNPIMGAILIILGILVITNQLSIIGNFPLANEIINLERGI